MLLGRMTYTLMLTQTDTSGGATKDRKRFLRWDHYASGKYEGRFCQYCADVYNNVHFDSTDGKKKKKKRSNHKHGKKHERLYRKRNKNTWTR
jgi:hypothetical protein